MWAVISIRHLPGMLLAAAALPLTAAPAPQLLVEAPPELQSVANEVRALEKDDFSEILLLTGNTGFLVPIRVVLLPESAPLAATYPGLAPIPNGGVMTVEELDNEIFSSLLGNAEHRDEVGRLLLHRAAAIVERCYLLAVHSEQVVGWLAQGSWYNCCIGTLLSLCGTPWYERKSHRDSPHTARSL